MFNGVGKTTPPAIVSIVFNTVRIPFALILASLMGVNGVWWTITITSIVKGIVSPVWFSFIQKRIQRN
jgi:Na+-driven multidrug efflux pump